MSDPILGQSLHCECVFDQYTQTNTYTHTQPHPQIITMNPSLLLAQRKKKRNHSVVGGVRTLLSHVSIDTIVVVGAGAWIT